MAEILYNNPYKVKWSFYALLRQPGTSFPLSCRRYPGETIAKRSSTCAVARHSTVSAAPWGTAFAERIGLIGWRFMVGSSKSKAEGQESRNGGYFPQSWRRHLMVSFNITTIP